MEVSKHFVRSPATDETDDVGIDSSTKQGHCAPRPEPASLNLMGVDAGQVELDGCSLAESCSNVGRADIAHSRTIVDSMERRVWWGGVAS